MKVIMNGFEIEGTPKEIDELLKISNENGESKNDEQRKDELILYEKSDEIVSDFAAKVKPIGFK